MVATLRILKSPHGFQPLPGLGVICKGDDHSELDLRKMHKSSILLNSALAKTTSCRQGQVQEDARAKTGGPVVVRWCSTPCMFSSEAWKRGTSSSGNSLKMEARSLLSVLTRWMPSLCDPNVTVVGMIV